MAIVVVAFTPLLHLLSVITRQHVNAVFCSYSIKLMLGVGVYCRKASTIEPAQTPALSNVVANEILHMTRILVGFTMPPRYNQLVSTMEGYQERVVYVAST